MKERNGDENAEPAAFFVENKAVVLHAKVNLHEKLVVAATKKEVLNERKDILLM